MGSNSRPRKLMAKRHYIIPIFIPHLGCPHQCIFCNQKEITGQLRELAVEEVHQQIDDYLETMSAADRDVEIAFYGGSFTGIPIELQDKYLAVAKLYLDAKKIDGIRLSTRPDYIDEKTLQRLKAFGVTIVELGVQSMDDQVLIKANRGHTAAQVQQAVELLQRYDFQVGLQMMVGLPGDSKLLALATAHKLISLQPDFVRIYPVLVITRTPLAELFQSGQYRPWSVEQAVDTCKELLMLFRTAGISVIRMGLQPSEEINENARVLAGPFHPAFGELVEIALVRDRLIGLCRSLRLDATVAQNLSDTTLVIKLSPRDESIVRGQGNSTIKELNAKFGFKAIRLQKDETLPRGEYQVMQEPDLG